MKSNYQVLSKEDKKKVKTIFKKDYQSISKRLNQSLIIGITVIVYCMGMGIYDILSNSKNVYLYGLYILFICAGIFFIIQSNKLRIKAYKKITKDLTK